MILKKCGVEKVGSFLGSIVVVAAVVGIALDGLSLLYVQLLS